MNVKSKLQRSVLRRLSLLALFCSFSFAMMAQTKTITGVVTSSEDGEKLVGVTVVIKGTTTGSVTNIDGKYSLPIKDNDATLVFSMVGMKSTEVKVGGKSVVNVVLASDTKLLEQVVVTGYSSQKKADLTGAVVVVDVAEMKKVSTANPMQALQGKVAGMVVTSDGSPSGSGTTIRIRGIGTINDNNPLYVIDGVPTKEGLNQLNPNDIESVQVLKDASSATIYGSRAANGVIIITTKKAKQGIKISANTRNSISWYSNRMKVLDANGYGRALWQAKVNDGLNPNSNSVI